VFKTCLLLEAKALQYTWPVYGMLRTDYECWTIHCQGRWLWFIHICVSSLLNLYIDYCAENICFFVTDEHSIT